MFLELLISGRLKIDAGAVLQPVQRLVHVSDGVRGGVRNDDDLEVLAHDRRPGDPAFQGQLAILGNVGVVRLALRVVHVLPGLAVAVQLLKGRADLRAEAQGIGEVAEFQVGVLVHAVLDGHAQLDQVVARLELVGLAQDEGNPGRGGEGAEKADRVAGGDPLELEQLVYRRGVSVPEVQAERVASGFLGKHHLHRGAVQVLVFLILQQDGGHHASAVAEGDPVHLGLQGKGLRGDLGGGHGRHGPGRGRARCARLSARRRSRRLRRRFDRLHGRLLGCRLLGGKGGGGLVLRGNRVVDQHAGDDDHHRQGHRDNCFSIHLVVLSLPVKVRGRIPRHGKGGSGKGA